MSSHIYIEDYSGKSFVVRGDTREYKDSLKALGGKWNSRLTDKQTDEKFGAWLFWSDKRSDLDSWLEKGCPSVQNSGESRSPVRSSSNYVSHGGDADRIKRLEEKVDNLTKMLTSICSFHNISMKESCEDEIVIEDDEPKAPGKRLLGKNRK